MAALPSLQRRGTFQNLIDFAPKRNGRTLSLAPPGSSFQPTNEATRSVSCHRNFSGPLDLSEKYRTSTARHESVPPQIPQPCQNHLRPRNRLLTVVGLYTNLPTSRKSNYGKYVASMSCLLAQTASRPRSCRRAPLYRVFSITESQCAPAVGKTQTCHGLQCP